jgi:hypothetical protein
MSGCISSRPKAEDLLEALIVWAEDKNDPGWRTHITDSGREFTLAIEP